MAAPSPKFQIAITGPPGMTFVSFLSTELAEGDPSRITLSNIRNKCNISNKLLFTADDKTSLDDQTTLEHYMSLTGEGNAILNPKAAPEANDEKKEGQPQPPPLAAGIPTFSVKVLDTTPPPAPLPETHATMAKLLEQVRQAKFLDRGALPIFENTELAALAANYAVNAGTAQHKEPGELTEGQWDAVLKNNRALHGYYFDVKTGILVKAMKPAFRLRSAAAPGKPIDAPKGDEKPAGVDSPKYNPSMPPFYINDTASVSVTEISLQTQKSLIKEGFNSLSVSGSLGGGMKIPVSVSAAFEQEHAWSQQEKQATQFDSLVATYNLPRVVIELDANSLEMTPECISDAIAASNEKDVERFYQKYGTVFATSFTLGGYLYSTRNVKKEEQSTLSQVRDETRKAVGLSIQTPKVSGSFGAASANGTGSENAAATLSQQARLTWDAHGGNTLLASNPVEWASTVKDYRLWRLMNQHRVVQLVGLIQDIHPAACKNLNDPSPLSDTDKDPIKDPDFNMRIRVLIFEAATGSDTGNNALMKQMATYYTSNKYDAQPALGTYLAFLQQNYPDSPAAIISPGVKFGGLTVDQVVYFGLFMASIRELVYN